MSRLRLAGTSFTSERVRYLTGHVCIVRDGERVLGRVEYVALSGREHGRTVTTYGWRPVGSCWSRRQLKSKHDAVAVLAARVEVSA